MLESIFYHKNLFLLDILKCCFTSKNNFCKLSALKCFDRIRSKFLQFNKTCFIFKSSLQFIHCGDLSLFKKKQM